MNTPNSTETSHPWLQRWKVLIVCRDCGATFECVKPAVSLDKTSGFSRTFIAGGPETCPECRNLKAVP